MHKTTSSLRRILLPQLNLGTVSWLLHRMTGVALAVYLLPHFITINASRGGPEALDDALGWYTGPLIAASEYLLVGAVAFHLFNGLRVMALDFFDLSHRQKALFWAAMGACVAVLAAASFLFLPRMLAPL